jgi:hypothetical protein
MSSITQNGKDQAKESDLLNESKWKHSLIKGFRVSRVVRNNGI